MQIHTYSGELIKVTRKKSKFGGTYYDCLFKTEGQYLRSCIYEQCRNFPRWKNYLRAGTVLNNLEIVRKNGKDFINADSFPCLIQVSKSHDEAFSFKVSKQEVLF